MAKAEAEPSENLFIGDLPATMDDAQLVQVFSAYGKIMSHKILAPGAWGGGNAVISFGTVDEARWLVENLNGNIPQGLTSPIQVRYKNSSKGGGKGKDKGAPQDAYMGSMGSKGGDEVSPSPTLFIGDLPVGFTDEMLTQVFSAYGSIKSHKMVAPGTSGKLACIVEFNTVEEATWIVLNLNGNIPQGLTEPIQARFKRDSKGKGGGGAWDASKGGGAWDAGKGGGGWDAGKVAADGGWDAGKGSMDGGMAPSPPSDSLFIGDLPADMDDQKLTAVFSAYGKIQTHKLLAPGTSGRLAAILTLGSVEEAKWMVENLNGNIPQGLTEPIKVRFKDQKGGGKGLPMNGAQQERPGPYSDGGGKGWDKGGSDKGAGKGYGKAGSCNIKTLVEGLFSSGAMPGGGGKGTNEEGTLFCGGLPYDTTDTDLYKIFSPFGPIAPAGVKAMVDPTNSYACKGFGFINFLNSWSAQEAIKTLNGTQMPDGKTLRVSVKQQGQGKGGATGMGGIDGMGGMGYAGGMDGGYKGA